MPILHAEIQVAGVQAPFAAGSFSFQQGTDYVGRPSTDVRVGLIRLTLVGEAASWLLWEEWMLDAYRRLSGRLVFHQNEGQTAKTVVFYDAFCVHYECRFDARGHNGQGSFKTEIHLSAAAEEVQGQLTEAHSVIPWPTDEATRRRALTKPSDLVPSASLAVSKLASLPTPPVPVVPTNLPPTAPSSAALALPADLAQLDLEATLDHVEYRDFSTPRKNGIGGAHNQVEFAKHQAEYTEIARVLHPTVPGVEKVEYKIQALDLKGNPTGQLAARVYEKTVYDPAVWPRPKLKEALQEALLDAYQSNNNVLQSPWWEGATREGHALRGVFRNGKIDTFFFK